MITLECNYSKKLGLPGYSSHQFAITLRTEIADLTQVQAETARLYKLLQEGVDTSIKETGYLPTNSNGNGRGQRARSGQRQQRQQPDRRQWCLELLRKAAEPHPQDHRRAQVGQERGGGAGTGAVWQRGQGAQQAGSVRAHRRVAGENRAEQGKWTQPVSKPVSAKGGTMTSGTMTATIATANPVQVPSSAQSVTKANPIETLAENR